MTKIKIDKYFSLLTEIKELKEEIREEALKVFNEINKYLKVDGVKYIDDIEDINSGDTEITIYPEELTGCARPGCCPPDYHSFSFPIEFLYNEKAKQEYLDKLSEEKKERDKRKVKKVLYKN